MPRMKSVVVTLVVLAGLAVLGAQAPRDDDPVWKAFMGWFKSAPPSAGNPLGDWSGPDTLIVRTVAVKQ